MLKLTRVRGAIGAFLRRTAGPKSDTYRDKNTIKIDNVILNAPVLMFLVK